MTPPLRKLAVFCGSATPEDPRYVALARSVGAELARRGIGVVYGGGRLGLMGALAVRPLAMPPSRAICVLASIHALFKTPWPLRM